MTPPPNCRIQDVTWLALFVHLSGLFISFYFHAFNTKTIVVGEGGGGDGGGGGGGGGGQNIMATNTTACFTNHKVLCIKGMEIE